MSYIRMFIKVQGIVQGVGFRPFVYNLALCNSLKGWVNNNSEGVYIDLEGNGKNLESFIYNLKNNAPPLSKIENISIEYKPVKGYKNFIIKKSDKNNVTNTLISPDIALCKDCERDILSKDNIRYYYPFTNCTNCGPRFSIISSIPYDRDKTSMKSFKMCLHCEKEYKNPLDRRFHAQPNACHICGPTLQIMDNNLDEIFTYNKELNTGAVINKSLLKFAKEKLEEGFIFAIKGLTGFHLLCNAKDDVAVKKLRERKMRPDKPFAVMMKDINTVKRHCFLTPKEMDILEGIKKPIVILDKKKGSTLSKYVAPNQNTLGVMLPYTPLHVLLFEEGLEALIATSANINTLPLEYKNSEALNNLKSIADYFLLHNRDIIMPLDDSVTRVVAEKECIIRRARGYVPEGLRFQGNLPILALGADMKNTFSLLKDNMIFMSGYNGDMDNIETLQHFKRNIQHFKNIFEFSPKYLCFDLHPSYETSKYGKSLDLPYIEVQHHHAHMTSCMAENNLKEKVIGICFDGTGYGLDKNLWGGEFLLGDYKDFERAAHLKYVKISNNDDFIKEPWRMAVSYINSSLKNTTEIGELVKNKYGNKALLLKSILDKNINTILTSSAGRLFDAVCSILGIRDFSTYEGQASIELEQCISKDHSNAGIYNYIIEKSSYPFIIDTSPIIKGVIKDLNLGLGRENIALKFHYTMVDIIYRTCKILRKKYNINKIVLSGGVFQNRFLLENSVKSLSDSNFEVYFPKKYPCNDGGISLGQIAIANEIITLQNKKYQ